MQEVLEEIERIKDKPVLVEGHDDRKSLERLGFTDIDVLNDPIYKVVENHQHDEEVVILTDLDGAGKSLYGRLARGFGRVGVKVNNRIRKLLFRFTDLRQIEGLANYIKRNSPPTFHKGP